MEKSFKGIGKIISWNKMEKLGHKSTIIEENINKVCSMDLVILKRIIKYMKDNLMQELKKDNALTRWLMEMYMKGRCMMESIKDLGN